MFKIKFLSWDFIQIKLLTWNLVMSCFEKLREASPVIMMAAEVCALKSLIKHVVLLVPLYFIFIEKNVFMAYF